MQLETELLEFGTLKIGEHLIIGEMNEGADIQMDAASRVKQVAEERFRGKRWGYISNRIHSYSINPIVHFEAKPLDSQMVALAVVTSQESQIKQVDLEKTVSGGKYAFELFSDLDEAIDWVNAMVVAG